MDSPSQVLIGVKDGARLPWQGPGTGKMAGVTGVSFMNIGSIQTAGLRRLLVLAFFGLAACAAQEPAFEQCEEGVSDLSRLSDVTPPC